MLHLDSIDELPSPRADVDDSPVREVVRVKEVPDHERDVGRHPPRLSRDGRRRATAAPARGPSARPSDRWPLVASGP